MRRGRAALAAAALALVAAGCGGSSPGAPRSAAARAAATNPAPRTTAAFPRAPDDVRIPPPPAVTLPTPDRPPSDPYADVPVRAIGTIEIPRIGLRHTIYEGIWLTVLDKGPGHWPGTALPGRRGNTVFPGHRVTNTRPFRRIDELRPGDRIVFRMPYGTYTYAVRRTFIVLPTAMWVVDQSDAFEATLIACHPPGSARQRIVVRAVLVKSVPKGPA